MNPILLRLAQERVWKDYRTEKSAVVPAPGPGGAPPGGPPPGDPAAGGAPPPMDPSMGGAPPGGAPPMDPSMMGGGTPPGMGGAPMMGGQPPGMPGGMMPPGMAQPQQKLKPEQMMMMLDYRMYNLQQQLTAICNSLDIKIPAGALILPPGSTVSPPAEAALPGGPQDPGGQTAGQGGGGGNSAIQPVEPIQGASPEMAQGKQASIGETFADYLDRLTAVKEAKESSPPKPLRGPHPGVRPSTQSISAGGSKDPLSQPDAAHSPGPVNEKGAADLGVLEFVRGHRPGLSASAVSELIRSKQAMAIAS